MTISINWQRLWLLGLLLAAACSGGGGDLLAGGGLTGSGRVSEGTITEIGSIVVNDIHYDIDQAEIIFNGEAAGMEQLKPGMHVTVETDETLARRVTYRDTLRGPLAFVTSSSLRVLGHTVQITPDTRRYGFADPGELQPGDTVRISGPASGPEMLPATLVERVPAGEARITGTVSNLDEAGHSFFIAGMQVFYGETQALPAQLYNGLPVEIIGFPVDKPPRLHARHIRVLTPEVLPAGSYAVIAGTVTRFHSLDDFEVQYRPARLLQNTEDGLGLGMQVKIRGVTDAQGVIEISEINLAGTDPIITPDNHLWRVSGPVSGIGDQTLQVFGVEARLNARTRFRDLSGEIPDYTLAEVRRDDYVALAGFKDRGGAFLAGLVSYDPFVQPENRQLQGPATDSDALNRRLHIFGVPVFTTTQTRYYDASAVEINLPPPGPPLQPPPDTETDAEAFFARLNGEFLVYAFGQVAEEGMVADMLVLLPFSVNSDP